MTEETARIRMADGVTLAVREYIGQGSANMPRVDVVLLHGWPASGRIFHPLADGLLLAGGCRLIAPDFRGFGESDKPADGFTCDHFAGDIQTVIETLALSHYILVGHSMGGKIAQILAARQPAGLAGLVLIAPSPLEPAIETAEPEQRTAFAEPEKRRALLTAPAARHLQAEAVNLILDDAARASETAWFGWMTMRKEDHAAEAEKITVPTLVVGGEKDTARDPETLNRDTVSHIRNAKFAAVPHVGHLVHLEEPTALAVLLTNFLETATLPGGSAS